MSYKYNVYLPGLDRTILANELSSKVYRDIVKSLYNKDGDLFLVHLNDAAKHVYPGIFQEDTTVIDYVILLLTARMICVNPDLKLTVTDPDTKKQFDVTIRIEDIVDRLQKLKHKNSITEKNITINYSLTKARDLLEMFNSKKSDRFSLYVSSLNSIRVGERVGDFDHLSTLEYRARIANSLPATITVKIMQGLDTVYQEISKTNFAVFRSPQTGSIISQIPVSLHPEDIVKFLKLVFNDDLGNVYKITYNLVSKAHFNPIFLDEITQAEQFLFWTYYLQQVNKENEEYERNKDSKGPSYDGINLSNIKAAPSEFSS